MNGKVSEVGGKVSETTNKNTAKDSSTVISKEIFSPASGGSRKPSRAVKVMRMQGNRRLNT